MGRVWRRECRTAVQKQVKSGTELYPVYHEIQVWVFGRFWYNLLFSFSVGLVDSLFDKFRGAQVERNNSRAEGAEWQSSTSRVKSLTICQTREGKLSNCIVHKTTIKEKVTNSLPL